jgi:hypothetical protein
MQGQIELVHTLRRVLRRKAIDEMVVASEFAGQHRDNQLIGERHLDTYKGYYSLLVGEDATVEWSETGDSVGKDRNGRWVFGLHQYDGASAAMHEAAHAMFSPLDYTQKVSELLSDKRIHLIANVIEDRRIEFLADVWWRGAGIYEKHRAELIRGGESALRKAQSYQHMGGVPIYTRHDPAGQAWHEWVDKTLADDAHNSGGGLTPDQDRDWVDTAVAIQVQLITYDLPGVVIDPTVQAVAKRFRQKILDAGCSLDRNAAIRVAVEIANFMDWHQPEPEEPEPRGGGGEPCEEGEEGTPQPGIPRPGGERPKPEPTDDTDEDEGEEEEADGAGSPEPADDEAEPDEGDDGNGGSPDQDEGDDTDTQDVDDGPGPEPTTLDKLLEQAEQQVTKEILRETEKTANKQAYDNRSRRSKIVLPGGHTATMVELKTEPIPPDSRVKAMLDSLGDISFNPRPQTSGTVTPKVWQIRHGNMKVFRQPPKRKGRTLIFVDCSGSMGCPCSECYRLDTAHKAWQVAGAVAKATGNAEVYAFGGGSHDTGIGSVPVGHQPTCRNKPDMTGINMNDVGNGTPICAALVYAEQLIHGAENTTTMVFITDGGASAGTCTFDQAARLHGAGVDFIAVNLGRAYDTFPASVTATLSDGDDYSDIGSLAPAIRHIRGK